MKILQVLSTLSPGGAEHFTVALTNELIRMGYECDLVSLFDADNNNALLKSLCPKAHHSSLNKRRGLDIGCCIRLFNFIKNGQYDVVHAHVCAIPYILLASVFLPKVKFFATIHSEAKRESGSTITKWCRFYMFKHNKCVPVTISDESKNSFEDFYNMDAPMIYNGAPAYTGKGLPPLRDNEEQLLFIHPASCQVVKNQELLIKAFAKLTVDYPNVKLLWLGNNKLDKPLFNQLVSIMVPQIKYMGTVEDVRDYLVQADAMCLSSKMEGMPMTIIEAFSVACPSLCTPVGGIRNMIEDGKNGMLSASLGVDDYYAMLKRFCDLTLSQKTKMRQYARESYASYSIEKTASNYLKLYNR